MTRWREAGGRWGGRKHLEKVEENRDSGARDVIDNGSSKASSVPFAIKIGSNGWLMLGGSR